MLPADGLAPLTTAQHNARTAATIAARFPSVTLLTIRSGGMLLARVGGPQTCYIANAHVVKIVGEAAVVLLDSATKHYELDDFIGQVSATLTHTRLYKARAAIKSIPFRDDRQHFMAELTALQDRLYKRARRRARELQRIIPGCRIRDTSSDGGAGIVLLVEPRGETIIYVNDSNQYGTTMLETANASDVAVMGDVPPLSPKALASLLARYMPKAAKGGAR